MIERRVYQLKNKELSPDIFENLIDEAWARLKNDPRTMEELADGDIEPAALAGTNRTDLISIEEASTAGFTGLEMVLINLTGGVALKVFDNVIFPWVLRRVNHGDVQLVSQARVAEAGQNASART